MKALQLSVFFVVMFLTGCKLYQNLYGGPEPVGEVVNVNESDIVFQKEINESVIIQENETAVETDKEDENIKIEKNIDKANVIIVEETETVSLVPKAEDEDNDKLQFMFSDPLDDNGEWKTNYGDAGEYTITVTVSDGELTSSKDVLIIVNKKEEAPKIESMSPSETSVSVKEKEAVEFNVKANDLNGDSLTYIWKLDGVEASEKESYRYESDYDSSGSHTIKIIVSDGTLSVENLWSLTVLNVNRLPVIEQIEDLSVKENERVKLEPKAIDPDGDTVSFQISEPVGSDGIWETTYDDAGEYIVQIKASDGTDEISDEVKIVVENVNRAPKILEIVKK